MLQHYQYGHHSGHRSGLVPDPSDPRFVSGGGVRSSGLPLLAPPDTGGRSGFESELHRALFPSAADRLNQQAGRASGFESRQLPGAHDQYADYRSRLDDHAIGETAERILRQMRQIDEDIEDRIRERLRELERQELTAADRAHLARVRAAEEDGASAARAVRDRERDAAGAREADRSATGLDLESLAQLLRRLRAAGDDGKPDARESDKRLSGLNAFAADEAAANKLDTLVRELLTKLEQLAAYAESADEKLDGTAESRARIGLPDTYGTNTSGAEDGEALVKSRVLAGLDRAADIRFKGDDGLDNIDSRRLETYALETGGRDPEELRELVARLRRVQQILTGEHGDPPAETDGTKAGERVQRLEVGRMLELLQRLRDEGGAAGNERVDAEAVARLRERLERREAGRRDDAGRAAERLAGREDDESRDPRVRVRDLRSRFEARHRARHEGDGEGRAGARAERAGSESGGRSESGEQTAGRASRGGELRAELSDGGESGAQRGVARADLAAWGQGSTASRAAAQQQAEAQLARHLRSELPDQVLRQAQMVIRGENEGEMRLSLYPPELGGVRVRMQVQDNLIAIRFIVENSTVRDVFEQNLHVLQQQLADSGFENAGIEVSVGGNSNGERQENRAGTHNREVEQLDSGVPPLVETYREDTQIDFMV